MTSVEGNRNNHNNHDNRDGQTQTQVDYSTRQYDGAKLTWHRVRKPGEIQFSHWFIVRIEASHEQREQREQR